MAHPVKFLKSSLAFDSWAMPVVSRPWALVSVGLEAIKRGSRFRLAVRPAHRAWEHAVGVR